METLARYLMEHPFLKGLAPRHIDLVVGCASNARFDEGEFLDRQGEPADKFWILRAGKVAIELYDPRTGPITIQTVGEGDVVGWSFLIEPYVGHFDARALELTRAIALDGACLRRKCAEDFELGYELYRRFAGIMAQRIEATQVQLLDVYK